MIQATTRCTAMKVLFGRGTTVISGFRGRIVKADEEEPIPAWALQIRQVDVPILPPGTRPPDEDIVYSEDAPTIELIFPTPESVDVLLRMLEATKEDMADADQAAEETPDV